MARKSYQRWWARLQSACRVWFAGVGCNLNHCSPTYSFFFGHSLGDSVLIWSRIYELSKPVLLSQCVATIDWNPHDVVTVISDLDLIRRWESCFWQAVDTTPCEGIQNFECLGSGWCEDVITFMIGRLTLWILHWMSWVGVGWRCGNVHDRTSYVADVTLNVLGWVGVKMW